MKSTNKVNVKVKACVFACTNAFFYSKECFMNDNTITINSTLFFFFFDTVSKSNITRL
ncbi:hypothetical protein BC941DRAFT_446777 [Chlamydoabsidia padenii]|nr:hypothetical protein BC941DRAFT_446777 [Chlamydoabsidia padenii]